MSSSAKEVDHLVGVILAHYKLELVRGAGGHGHGPGDETIVRTSAGGRAHLRPDPLRRHRAAVPLGLPRTLP